MQKMLSFIIVFWFISTMSVGAAYVAIDQQTGRILESNQPFKEMPIASLTKIWTAFIVLENVR